MGLTKKEIAEIIIRYIDKGYGWSELYFGDDLYNYPEDMKEFVQEMYDECLHIGRQDFYNKYIYFPKTFKMIKTYKSIKDYAEAKGICSKTASKKIKNNLVEVFEVPKGAKYYEIDLKAVMANLINK